MTLNQYQADAISTAFDSAKSMHYLAPGLAGEIFELQEVVAFFFDRDTYHEKVLAEVGDVFWFIALIADEFDWSLENVILDCDDEELYDSLDAYQSVVISSLFDGQIDERNLALELGAASNDIVSVWAKAVRDNAGEVTQDKQVKLKIALNDAFFSASRLAFMSGWNIEEVMSHNIDKLFSRKARGKLSGSGDNR